jgi:hypothetical protein
MRCKYELMQIELLKKSKQRIQLISSSQVLTEFNRFPQLNYKFLLKIRSRNKARNKIQIKY